MIENEIAKSKRKKKASEPEEIPLAKKTAKKPKAAEERTMLKESDGGGVVKPVKKTRAVKKAAGGREKIASTENISSASETIAPPALAETPNLIEGAAEDSVSKTKPRRRKPIVAKKAVDASVSSPVRKRAAKAKEAKTERLEAVPAAVEAENQAPKEVETTPEKEESPIFKELAEPKLPVLPQENRARLQMQSPNRIFFYWSVKHNPFETLNRAFMGRGANYTLTIKLVNLSNNTEEIYPVEPSGSWWFNVNSNTAYRAEVGFFAENRPFVRLMYSNTVQTPRSVPSPNTDWSTDFTVSTNQFAEVLDAAGYGQDAFDAAIAGDDKQASDAATQDAFFHLTGRRSFDADADELRYALFVLASGGSLEDLRGRISSGLFDMLGAIVRENAEKLSAENVLATLHENFEFEDESDEFLAPVFGASAVNFPKKNRRPKFPPVSSPHPVTSR